MRKRIAISLAALVLLALSVFTAPHFREAKKESSLASERVRVIEVKQSGETFYRVSRVIDGDTIDVEKDGARVRVRLIGVDTPETVDPRRPVECFGKEASGKAKELLEGKLILLETDPSQGRYDKYQRMLAYVYLSDGTFFNKEMISEGYAHEYTYRLSYRYREEFKAAERVAREEKRGLWADGVCSDI
jgi:micrococcal nuclease